MSPPATGRVNRRARDRTRSPAPEGDGYLAGRIDELVAERLLERIIGRLIDVNYHLLTDAGQPPPRDDYDSFTALAKLRVLPADFAVLEFEIGSTRRPGRSNKPGTCGTAVGGV